MNRKEAVLFIFNIAQEVKRSFENPVILITRKDYAESIFKSLVDVRTALVKHANPDNLADIVYSFHLEWLQAVKEIEAFKKKFNTMPRQSILNCIDFTLECVKKRQEYFQKFVNDLQSTLTVEEKNILKVDVGVMRDMRQIVHHALIQKQKALCSQADLADFYITIINEIEELLNWLDKLNDSLAIEFCKVLQLKFPLHPNELHKTLQDIIDEVTNLPNPEAELIADKILLQSQRLSHAIRISSLNDLEISKIIDKIKQLEDRIHRLKLEKSYAVTALEHKAMYLEERLRSLENLKLSINSLQNQNRAKDSEENFKDYKIFNHLLPIKERCKLVENLMKLWNNALHGNRHVETQSIISILSAADLREVYSDENGQFFVDKFGRKIYQVPQNDILYQLNERHELVPLRDDETHLYFYDECGRYYLSENKERIYKAHEQASEYLMDRTGMLVKYSERSNDGIKYYYDNLGRYYKDERGNRIYCEKGETDEYISDGLGNLVRIKDESSYVNIIPREPMAMEENLYLKGAIGDALKKCLAEVVLAQPSDPINYLADSLEKYQRNIVDRQNRLLNAKSLMLTRAEMDFDEITLAETKAKSLLLNEQQEIESNINFTGNNSEISHGYNHD